MTEHNEELMKKIANIFPADSLTNLIKTSSDFRIGFEKWYKKKYGKEYDWKQGGDRHRKQL